MVLVVAERRTWTIGLFSVYVLHNTILARTWKNDRTQEPLFLGSGIFQKNYRFEDFFWTGSGDGSITDDLFNKTYEERAAVPANPYDAWRTQTIFHTTTILFATVYPNVHGCSQYNCLPEISPVSTESIDFSLPAFPPSNEIEIRPTPSFKIPDFSTSDEFPARNSTFATDVVIKTQKISPTTAKAFTSPNRPQYSPSFGFHEPNRLDLFNITTTVFPEIFLDQKYWLLTILKSDYYMSNVDVIDTERKLSNLYEQAFIRRRGKYHGENGAAGEKYEDVKAHIVNVTRIGPDIGLVYTITVSGKPIPAITAANDMRLMTESEVVAELGRPILTKAEPYLKAAVPLGARVKGRARDTWLLIGCIIAAVCLLLLLVGLFAWFLSKNRSKKKSGTILAEEGGTRNLAFEDESDAKIERPIKPPRSSRSKLKEVNSRNESGGSTVKFKGEGRRESFTSSSCSGSSDTGLASFYSESTRRERQIEGEGDKPKAKPRNRERRIQSSEHKDENKRRFCGTSARSALRKSTQAQLNDSEAEEFSSRMIRSPTPYLSMPSVKAFPRGTKIPEPINKILEPTIIRHLDADSDSQKESSRRVRTHRVEVDVERTHGKTEELTRRKGMTRHGSLEGDDPGVIGPIVWNKHCQKIFGKDTDLRSPDQYNRDNVGRMRKRFNELLDDAMSMFGSSSSGGSSEGNDLTVTKQQDNRIHSAVFRSAEPSVTEISSTYRPYTTGSKKPKYSNVSGPKGAWETPSCSTLAARPLSAGVCAESSPKIDKNLIYVDSELSPNDPAIPLIAAIKNELKKFDGSPRNDNDCE